MVETQLGGGKTHVAHVTVGVFWGRVAAAFAKLGVDNPKVDCVVVREEAPPRSKKAKQPTRDMYHYGKQRRTASKLARSKEKATNPEGEAKDYNKCEDDILHLLKK